MYKKNPIRRLVAAAVLSMGALAAHEIRVEIS